MAEHALVIPKRWKMPSPASLRGEWRQLYQETLEALLERYASRGPQYEMLCDLAAGLYVQVRRMEATGAIRGLDTLDMLIARQFVLDATELEQEQATLEARKQLAEADKAIKTYLQAVEVLRKLIDQAQRYTEARRQEVVVVEVNSAVVETLRIVETFVDPQTMLKITLAVQTALKGGRAA